MAAGTRQLCPIPLPTPFSPSLGVGTQINDFSRNDGFAPYSQQWNINVQREMPCNMFVTAHGWATASSICPARLNTPNQLDPGKYLAVWVAIFSCSFQMAAQAKGYQLPYPNFVNDFGGSARR